jgi:DNA-binding PadR family transcriptional regulator
LVSAYDLEPQNLARSCHEALILSALNEGPRHGYQIALDIEERSSGRFRFNHGTLYPILHELEAVGFIDGSWADPAGKRKRRQYTLTAAGREHFSRLCAAWREFADSLTDLIEGRRS